MRWGRLSSSVSAKNTIVRSHYAFGIPPYVGKAALPEKMVVSEQSFF